MLGRAVAAGTLCLAIAASAALAGPRTRHGSAALLARYEPVFQLYASDRTPSAIEPFLAGANLERLSGSSWRLVRRSPPASALANGSTQLRLNTRGCTPAVNL